MRASDLNNLIPRIVGEETLPDLIGSIRTLGVLADYKYDEYQQFTPGHRFMDSLVKWLSNIPKEHHKAALELVFRRLVFFSRADVFHFTKMAYPYKVRPRLIEWEAQRLGLPMHQWVRFSRSDSFHLATRRTLFLGLSDGAHLDDFRRLGGIHNDQVHTSYHLPQSRAQEMVEALQEHIEKKKQDIAAEGYQVPLEATFNRVVLVDDFTASGISFIRHEEGKWKGKLVKFLNMLDTVQQQDTKLVDGETLRGILLFYIATDQARTYIERNLATFNKWRSDNGKKPLELEFHVVQPLRNNTALTRPTAGELASMIEGWDVSDTYDKSMKKGGEDGHQKWGFNQCGLPVILYHNTPNNSIAPLWVYRDPEDRPMPGLFPRIRRHWDVE